MEEFLFHVDTRRLRIFEAVAGRLSFTQAGTDLNLAQTAVSRQIRCLELELGVRLFERTRREVRLTPAGQALLEQVPVLHIAWRNCFQSLRGFHPLRVGILVGAVQWFLPEILEALCKSFPGLQLKLSHLDPVSQRVELEQGRLELSFTRSPGKSAPAFLQEQYVVVCPKQLEDPSLKALLEAYPLTLFEPEGCPWLGVAICSWFDKQGLALKDPVASQSDLAVLQVSVEAGLTFSVLPACSVFERTCKFFVYRLASSPHLELALESGACYHPHLNAVLGELWSRQGQVQQMYNRKMEAYPSLSSL